MTQILGIPLPEAWSASPLKHVTSFLNRGTAPDYVDDGPVRVVGQAANQDAGIDWSRTRFHGYQGNPASLKGYLRPADVIINSTGTGTLGRVGFFTSAQDGAPCMADGHVSIARFDPNEVHSRFAYYWMRSQPFQDYVYAALVVGATNQIELNRDRLAGAPIPVPPLAEQRQIADFLDAETARIDNLIQLNSQLIRLLYERRQAAIDGEVESASKVYSKLFWHLALLRDGTHQPPPRVASGIPLLTARNISSGTLRLTDTDTFVSEENADELERSLKLAPGDVLLSVKGTIGACAVTPLDFARAVLDRNIAVLRPRRGFSSSWLAYVLRSTRLQEQMRMSVTAAAQPGLPLGSIRELRIPRVEAAEQHKLAAHLTDQCREIDTVLSKARVKETLLAERRQALITAAVAGQIDVSTASGRGVDIR